MKVSELIDKLKEMPQDEEITPEILGMKDDEYGRGMIFGMALTFLLTQKQLPKELADVSKISSYANSVFADLNRFEYITGK